MSNTPKDVVKNFYRHNIVKDFEILENLVHPDVELVWNSTDGLTLMHYNDIKDTLAEIRRTYDDARIAVSHILEDGNHVTIRYKYYVRTIENPDEELGIAHFIAIWEVKDGKLYRGHQVSQPVMTIDDSNGTYDKVKV